MMAMLGAVQARLKQGEKTADDLLDFIIRNPGFSSYEIAHKLSWSGGRVRAALKRLEKTGQVRFRHVGKKKLVFPVEWYEMLDWSQMGFVKFKDLPRSLQAKIIASELQSDRLLPVALLIELKRKEALSPQKAIPIETLHGELTKLLNEYLQEKARLIKIHANHVHLTELGKEVIKNIA